MFFFVQYVYFNIIAFRFPGGKNTIRLVRPSDCIMDILAFISSTPIVYILYWILDDEIPINVLSTFIQINNPNYSQEILNIGGWGGTDNLVNNDL